MSACLVDDNNPCGYYELKDGKEFCTYNNCECVNVLNSEDCSWDPESAEMILTD